MWVSSLPECVAAIDMLVHGLLLDAAVKGVVVMALMSLATLAMCRASAAARHWVWLLGVVSLLMLPVLSATLPGWYILPGLAGASGASMPRLTVAGASAPDRAVLAQVVMTPSEGQTSSRDRESERNVAGEQAMPPKQSLTFSQPSGSLRDGHGAQEAPTTMPWTVWFELIWLLGSVLLLGRLLLGFLSLWWLQRRSARISQGEWMPLLGQLCSLLGIRRSVELLSNSHRTMPMTWGLWRTRVLLPEPAASWRPEQRRAVLLHELAHAKRWDCLTQVLTQVACAVHWFNPLVWVAWRRMQAEQERACDDLVLSTGTKASAYAEYLLQSASLMRGAGFSVAAIAMARPSTLEERLRAILDPQRNRRGMTRWKAIGTILLSGAVLAPVAVLKAQDRPARDAAGTAAPAATQPTSRLQVRPVLNEGEGGAFDEVADPGNPQRTLRVGRESVLNDSAIASADVVPEDSRMMMLVLNGTGMRNMQRWSRANAGRRVVVMFDGKVVSSLQSEPRIGNPLWLPIAGQDDQTARAIVEHFGRSKTMRVVQFGMPGAFGPATRPSGGTGPTTRPGVSRVFRGAAPLAPGEGPTCGLDGTVYELRLPPEQIGRIDVAALTRAAATPAALEKALADLGAMKPLYRASQSVRLAGDSITLATSTPVVTASRKTNSGQVINTVQYQQTGAIFSIAGRPGAGGRMEVDLRIELAALGESAAAIMPNMQAPVMRHATLVHKSPVDAGQPFVIVSVDAASLDPAGKAVAYVARITLGAPQSATRPTRAE
ncbi:MAG: M56 family metallopeptidase [Bacillota bacterium]